MSRATASVGRHAEGGIQPTALGYLGRSATPLTSLVFLLPFIVVYELGTRVLLTDAIHGTQHIIAFTLLQQFFALFGATGRHLPALAVVAILIAWHLARRDSWALYPGTMLLMVLESIALVLPLIVFGIVLARLLPLSATTSESIAATFVLSLGAGIYEELVFRLMLCTLLAMFFRNILRLQPRLSMLLLVVVSATLFSAYHYLGTEAFNWRVFAFRMGAGMYFAGLFLARGFGVTAGTHTAYDILIVML